MVLRGTLTFTVLAAFACLLNSSLAAEEPVVVRCAVIGGLNDTGLWQAVSGRFEQSHPGYKADIAVTGPKDVIAEAFREGEADLITMHASDTIINLVADGYGVDPQPWARNDFVLVGPAEDPAGVKGGRNAVRALNKLLKSQSKLVLHGSQGVNEVLNDLLVSGDLDLDPSHTISSPTDRHREMLMHAADYKAYAIVGRIPFLNGKIPDHGLEVMVQGDRRMRRPYVVVTRTSTGDADAQAAGAVEFAKFLRAPETQEWLSTYGKGKLDDQPLFFPVTVPTTRKN